MTGNGYPPLVYALTTVPNARLTGIILPRSRELTELRTLNLQGIKLHGVAPVQLCNMANLSVLDLSGNRFEGPTRKPGGTASGS